MLEWYWGLSGITWFITTFLIGAIPIAFCGALVILMAKSIAKATDHDPQTCPCRRCEYRRARSINHRYSARSVIPEDQQGRWLATSQLEEGMVIIARSNGNPYSVRYVEPRQYGYVVILRNMNTNRQSWMTIQHSRAHAKIWKLASGGTGRILGL